MADRILPVGKGGVLGSSKSMSKMRVNPYRDRAKSFYQRYVISERCKRNETKLEELLKGLLIFPDISYDNPDHKKCQANIHAIL